MISIQSFRYVVVWPFGPASSGHFSSDLSELLAAAIPSCAKIAQSPVTVATEAKKHLTCVMEAGCRVQGAWHQTSWSAKAFSIYFFVLRTQCEYNVRCTKRSWGFSNLLLDLVYFCIYNSTAYRYSWRLNLHIICLLLIDEHFPGIQQVILALIGVVLLNHKPAFFPFILLLYAEYHFQKVYCTI